MSFNEKVLSISNIDLLIFCGEGVGRSQIGSEILARNFPQTQVDRGGLRIPESGRLTMHPAVISTLTKRGMPNISDRKVKRLSAEMISERTIAVGFVDIEDKLPDFLIQSAYDVLIGYMGDPGGDVKNKLDHTTNLIAYYAWLTTLTLNNNFEALGTNRNKLGEVIPRNLNTFLPAGMSFKQASAPFMINRNREYRAFYLE